MVRASASDYLNAPNTWQHNVYQLLEQADYDAVLHQCQQAITDYPHGKLAYWFLGLALLLKGEEVEAQTTWTVAMLEGETVEIAQWMTELELILDTAANQQAALENYQLAWVIRQHQREVNPASVNNLLKLVLLNTVLGRFTGNDFEELGVLAVLEAAEPQSIDLNLLLQTLKEGLLADVLHPGLLAFARGCLLHIHQSQASTQKYIHTLLKAATEIAFAANQPRLAVEYAKLCLHLDEGNLEVLGYLADFYHEAGQYSEAIATAQRLSSIAETLQDRIFANTCLIRSLTQSGGYWQAVSEAVEQQEILLRKLAEQEPILDRIVVSHLINATFPFAYIRDQPTKNRLVQEALFKVCQQSVQTYASNRVRCYREKIANRRENLRNRLAAGVNDARKLRIGYLSYCFRSHSVGWLARWLIEYHDREKFDVYLYFVNYRLHTRDTLQDWYVRQATVAYKLGRDGFEVADRIANDDINILVDLDSITADISYEAIALKPAPIQVSWLGYDASGTPAVDYFITDPYVLPENAQTYYQETLCQLPNAYIAVDGFEVGVPTLRRDHLGIPDDAVIYFSSQVGYKRHPDTVRLQMKILSAVPNSYFLIKGQADQEAMKHMFHQIGEEEGVGGDRLRFLPLVKSEAEHRANLGIADVVLDTYPYNGATTTLETLWMGIPLVTRVGTQFAARNSYTMLMNVGVTEGIAWTDEEYVDWGIRLGTDQILRQQVAWKLLQSRKTAPLWNGRQFARDMENAYQQMWANWVKGF